MKAQANPMVDTTPKGDRTASEAARRHLEKAEAGDASGAGRIADLEKGNPEATEAAEQVASDGPKGRGQSR